MARLPTVGGDDGNWGTVLNEYLGVAHNSDGTSKTDARGLTVVVAASNANSANGKSDYACDGTADNIQIQEAIDLVATTGGVVRLTDGTFDISSKIIIKSNIKLIGVGDLTVLKSTATLDSSSGVIEAASAATRFEISDLTIDGNASALVAGAAGNGIYLVDAVESSIRRINFLNIGQSKTSLRVCIRLDTGCSDIFIDEPRGISNQASPTLWYGVYDAGATRTTLQNPYFYGFGDEPVVFFNAQDFKWLGGRVAYGANNTAGNGVHGCHITSTNGSCRGLIFGIESDNNYDDGIKVDQGSGGLTNVSIIGCNCHNNGNIGINCSSSGRIENNRCYNNSGGSSNAGIYISGSNSVVIGNHCYNNGQSGIMAGTGTTDLVVIGNVCRNISGSDQNYGLRVASGVTEVLMIGNIFAGNATTPIQFDGSGISLFDWFGDRVNVSGLPTSNPAVTGQLWSNGGVLTVSSG